MNENLKNFLNELKQQEKLCPCFEEKDFVWAVENEIPNIVTQQAQTRMPDEKSCLNKVYSTFIIKHRICLKGQNLEVIKAVTHYLVEQQKKGGE